MSDERPPRRGVEVAASYAVPARYPPRGEWLNEADCRLEDLLEVVAEPTRLEDYPHASRVEQQVLVFDAPAVAGSLEDPDKRRSVRSELVTAFAEGPGIVVFEGAFDARVVDRVTVAFNRMIEEQRAAGVTAGDHFAKPGANDRVWNALEKLAVIDPEAFVDYYANDVLELVCSAWLGPGYQVTSQVNVVNPGGEGQSVHCDYHLGFQSPEASAQYPRHVHELSSVLTLQGAVAHCDMPLVSGPTLYLPHSQKYPYGYLAYRRPEFQEHFVEHHVQRALRKGDAVFFNPALFHAAGSNHSKDILRMANLLQVSSAFGRAMETVDRARVVNAIYPTLLDRKGSGWSDHDLQHAVAAAAEGYSFPTNLDRDQPVGGMAPPTQAALLWAALAENRSAAVLAASLAAQTGRQQSH